MWLKCHLKKAARNMVLPLDVVVLCLHNRNKLTPCMSTSATIGKEGCGHCQHFLDFSIPLAGSANVSIELTSVSVIVESKKGRKSFVEHRHRPRKRDFTIRNKVTRGGAVTLCTHRTLHLQACADAGPIR